MPRQKKRKIVKSRTKKQQVDPKRAFGMIVPVLKSPTKSFRKIAKSYTFYDAIYVVMLILVLGLISDYVDGGITKEGIRQSTFDVGGWLLGSFIFAFVGKRFGGKADYKQMLAVMGYAQTPLILGGLSIVLLSLINIEIISIILAMFALITVAWTLILSLIAIREAHGLSNGRAILTFLWPIGLIASFFLKKKR